MSPTPTLGELAAFITSKNAGPFLVTIDVVFKTDADYRTVRDSGALTPEVVADVYRRDVADVTGIYRFDPARAIKVTMRRVVPSGSPGDTDVYGAQQHVPLMNLPLPFLAEADDGA
jgi:hypothetical protein